MPITPITLDSHILLLAAMVALHLVLFFTATGAPCVALLCERLGQSRKKVFWDKFALQIASLGLFTALAVACLSVANHWLVMHLTSPEGPQTGILYPAGSLGPQVVLTAGLFCAALLFLLIYKTTWKALKNSKAFHQLLGLASVLTALAGLFFFQLLKQAAFRFPFASYVDPSLSAFLDFIRSPELDAFFWPLLAQSLLLCLSAAGALGLVYLIFRRKAEDYGRDYYLFSTRVCAKWALFPCLIQLLALGWLIFTLKTHLGPLDTGNLPAIFLAAAWGCFLLACLAWIVIVRAENPLRAKAAMFFGLLLLLLAIFCQAVFLVFVTNVM